MGKYTTITKDDFSNQEIIVTTRKKKIESYNDPVASILMHTNDINMMSMHIKFHVSFFITLVCKKNSSLNEIYIEFLNHFEDGYATQGDYGQDLRNSTLDFIIDNENISLKPVIIDEGESHYARSGMINKEIYTRNQKLGYHITIENLIKFCESSSFRMRLSNIIKPCRVTNTEENKNCHIFESNAISNFQILCQGFYNDITGEEKFTPIEVSLPPETKKGCFIATVVMNDYNHPVVIDLRIFRDNWLVKRKWGLNFTNWYYQNGPIAANFINKSKVLKKTVYYILIKPLHKIVKYIQ